MAFPHKVRITRATGGTTLPAQDEDTGTVAAPSGGALDVYDGKGNFLDEGQVVEWSNGVPVLQADGMVVLPKRTVEKTGVQEGDAVLVTYGNGDERDMSVMRAVRFTDILYVRRA